MNYEDRQVERGLSAIPFENAAFVARYEWVKENLGPLMVDLFDEFVTHEVFEEYPEQAVGIYRILALHGNPDMRLAAAAGIPRIVGISEKEGIALWQRLLTDAEPRVASMARSQLETWSGENPKSPVITELARSDGSPIAEQSASALG